jgi:photosystem II stability/assembly factor-like uncharacterized protein
VSILKYLKLVLAISVFSFPLESIAQWIQTSGISSSAGQYVSCFAASGTNLFAGTHGSGVFLSTNNGTSWISVNTGLTNPYVYALAVYGTNLFAGTDYSGVYLSTDNGTSWTAVNLGLPSYTSVVALAVSGTNIFAGTYGSGIFLSTNNGTTWAKVDSGLTSSPVYALAVSGTNLFAGTYGSGVFLSTNNGTSWISVNTGLTNPYVYALAVYGTNLFAGTNNDGQVYLSINNGTSWTAVNLGLPLYTSVYALAVYGTNLFAGFDWGWGVWRRPLSEMILPSCLSQSVVAFGSIPADSTKTDTLRITNNFPFPLLIDWVYTGTKWFNVVSIRGKVVEADTMVLLLSFTPDTSKVYLDTLYILSNASVSLTKVPLSGNGPVPQIVLTPTVVAFGFDLGDSTMTDTVRITDNYFFPLIIDSVYTSTRWFAVASVHDTITEADTVWLPVSFTPDTTNSYSDTLYVLSNASVPFMKVPLSGYGFLTAVSQKGSGIPESYGISQNYPNPFNPTTTINYQLPVNGFVTLKIYDLLGRKVATLVNGRQNAGYYYATFNASNLPSGVYFYRLQAGSFMQTRKS